VRITPNKPAAANSAIASRLQAGCQWRGSLRSVGCNMRIKIGVADWIVVAWFVIAGHSAIAADDRTSNNAKARNAPAAVVIDLGEAEWFSNIRNERLVGAAVRITNNSIRSFWIMSRGTNEFVHDYERRRTDRDQWELDRYFCGTGTSPHEIRPGATFVTRKVFLRPQDVGADVRLRLWLFGRLEPPRRSGGRFPLRDPEEFLSNIIHIGRDPSGTHAGVNRNDNF